ncbi:3-hydroxyacyl-CoA dehydrogenase [Xylariales sp. PMI_506]|nr:3-hydroxyacyl-CoA dehydrogenase [Xylariales sp. PMI_506]
MAAIQNVAIIGCGAIGASWAALFLAQGLTVKAFDISPAAETFMRDLVRDALPVLSSIGLVKKEGVKPEDIFFTTNMNEALEGADFVQENGPERLPFKRQLFGEVAAQVKPDTIIATSSSGLTCSSIQEGMEASALPERCVVAHPFNPPHLIPLVEVVGGSQTSAETIKRTMDFYTSMGKKAIHVKKEMPGHVANRLQGALMREVLYLVQEGACSISDIDDAVAYGPGLRWGIMGPSLLLHLGGGERGVRHFADHLWAPLHTWYAPQDPDSGDEVKQKWVDGVLETVAGREYKDLAKQRDEELVGLLNLRKQWDNFAFEAQKQ